MNLLVKRNGSLVPTLLNDVVEVDDFFNTNLFDLENKFFSRNLLAEIPPANIIEKEKAYVVELAVPGMEKKDFTVELEGDYLTVSAKKETKLETKENGCMRKEFSYNSFSRSFHLPENSKPEKILAEYLNGILKIEIPKKEITVSKQKKGITVS